MSAGRVLVIAGSDSSGGAGLEADQKVIAVHGCYALTATTALTAQNTLGVQDIHVTPSEFVRKQLNACLDDIDVDVVKTGMLASASTIHVIADTFERRPVPQVVVDPVMVSTSGSQLLPREAVKELRERLLPLTTILTPNVPEALLLLQDAGLDHAQPKSLDDVIRLAKAIQKLGPRYVLLKGGHIPFTEDYKRPENGAEAKLVVDVLTDGQETFLIETGFLKSENTHGTGCSLASAIASNLAQGKDVPAAVRAGCRYVEAGIKTSSDLGKGNGPINHFHSLRSLPFSPGRFLEYLLDRPDVKDVWGEFVHHDFVYRLADGTLPIGNFKNYLVQDYLYLVHFARSNALAAYKSKDMVDIAKSAQIVLHIEREMSLHLDYCRSFGLMKQEMERHKEDLACTAYSRYILDVGQSEDWLALQMALAPCLHGYGAIAKHLSSDKASVREENPYWNWVENYIAEDYTEAVRIGSELLEERILGQSPQRIEELVQIFIRATEMEIGFWDMGLKKTWA